MKELLTPSYWLGSGVTTEDKATTTTEHEARHVFNNPPSHSHSTDTSQATQGDGGGTKSENPSPSLSVSKQSSHSNQAWKKNMISLNDEMETGPSQVFQNEAGGPVISSSESSSANTLHNTKLFIPESLTTPQHSTPLKKNDKVTTQSGSDPTDTVVTNEMDTISDQQESSATSDNRKMSIAGSSAVPQLEIHQSGSMLTPPGIK